MPRSGYSKNVVTIDTLTAYTEIPANRFVKMLPGLNVGQVALSSDGMVEGTTTIGVSMKSADQGFSVEVAVAGVVEIEATEDFVMGGWPKAGNFVTNAGEGKVRAVNSSEDYVLGFALTSASEEGDKIAVLLSKFRVGN